MITERVEGDRESLQKHEKWIDRYMWREKGGDEKMGRGKKKGK